MAITDKISAVADATRARSGYTEPMTLDEMAVIIENIPQPDLTPYATIEYVDEQIETIELTPGPAGKDGQDGAPGKDGKDGEDGKDYVLTEEDKQEIASMVDVSGGDVDLSDYYTKEEIDGLLANLPVGDIPSGEEVEW
jgi:hypothetical protein